MDYYQSRIEAMANMPTGALEPRTEIARSVEPLSEAGEGVDISRQDGVKSAQNKLTEAGVEDFQDSFEIFTTATEIGTEFFTLRFEASSGEERAA